MEETDTPDVAAGPPGWPADLGSGALVLAVSLDLLALAGPVATTRSTNGTGTGTATSGWFGSLVGTDGAGVRTATAGAVPAFGWAALAGVALLLAAGVLRLRTGRAPTLTVLAAGWLVATGVLVALHTAARAERLRDVLARVVPGQVGLTGSAGPWLLMAAGVVAGAAALAPRRTRRPPRVPPPPLAVWDPLAGDKR